MKDRFLYVLLTTTLIAARVGAPIKVVVSKTYKNRFFISCNLPQLDLYGCGQTCWYSVWSSCSKTLLVGLKYPFNTDARKSRAAKPVASMNPYLACPIASLTAAIASGARTADAQVKNKMTPAAAPCSDFGMQLIPFELIVG